MGKGDILPRVFDIGLYANIANLFGTWLNGIDKVTKARIRIGVAAILWTIWNCRNDIIFNNKFSTHYLQVIHQACSSIHLWSFLLPVDQRGLMDAGCSRLLAIMRAIFSQSWWRLSKRIDV